ncbi:hypothetical protein J5N58_14780 [Rhizobium cremeum]|uniref:hypothetical protein n=1 Tax=Rhizobium cremeum TaxID=2813827 RepID=UPI000DD8C298|nr:hypothetical protein [Rhizobium cremeum]MCJ7995447.1 hypothetical protein [Rhizobium cremeum]MCJ8000945.1 hypothetical protein [Rhizobium cremeum]
MSELNIYRLVPSAPVGDPRWQNNPYQEEIVVRAHSSGDARIVAQEAELDFPDVNAKPAEGVQTDMASAFRNEKLFTVIRDDSGRFSPEGPRGVLAGDIRRGVIAAGHRPAHGPIAG